MSESGSAETRRRRPPWGAVTAGWLVAVTLGWILLLVLLETDNARLDEAGAFEGDGDMRPPALLTLGWVLNAAGAYVRVAILALAYAIPLMLLIALLERRSDPSLRAWLLAGLLAMLPSALILGAYLFLSPRPVPPAQYVTILLILGGLGLAGGAAARFGPKARS